MGEQKETAGKSVLATPEEVQKLLSEGQVESYSIVAALKDGNCRLVLTGGSVQSMMIITAGTELLKKKILERIEDANAKYQ